MGVRFVLAAGAFALMCASASASTLTFGSFAGSSATGLSNGTTTYMNTMGSGSVVAYANGAYATPFAGTTFVSYTTSSAATANYTTMYTTSYTGNLLGATGSLSVLVDNDVTAYLNGFLVGSGSSFTSPTTFSINSSDFLNGANVFTFYVLNDSTGGPTAFDFMATAATPEPGSLFLLGTGLLGGLGVLKRRFI